MPPHVNDENQWVFIHVPKTGGTSMERVLKIKGTIHLTAKTQRGRHPDYFLWGFVRHPCDRILSAYYYECRAKRKPTSFDGLREYVESPPKKLHTVPQVDFTHDGDKLLLDFVGHFESINEDYHAVCDRLGIESVSLPTVNRTPHPDWTELFTTKMMKQTQRNFSADFELFDYDPFTAPERSAAARGTDEETLNRSDTESPAVRTQSWKGTIPIYINNFNWLTWPEALAEFFSNIPRTEVIFIDNASTYPPLLDWYANACPYKVIRLEKNSGPYAAWAQKVILPRHVHRGLFGSEYYVVSDPDLSFAGCPPDVLDKLIEGIRRSPAVNKVGVSLEIEDVPGDSMLGSQAKQWEQKFWQSRFDDQFFRAAVDTTFAMYSIDTPHRQAMQNNRNALRIDRPYTARHMPWYLNSDGLTEEQLYYFESTRNGMWSRKVSSLLSNQNQLQSPKVNSDKQLIPDPAKVFWYRDSNFGDALNDIFLPSFGHSVCWTSSQEAEIIGIGSVLGCVPSSFSGMILGAGFMGAGQNRSFRRADIQIVRGRYTAERCSAPSSTCLGDPGLLVKRFLSQPAPTKYSLGLLPHYVDKKHPGILSLAQRYPDEILVIDIRGTAQQVLTAISSCAAIASSSLHGLIAADALGISNVWLKLSDKICGGKFKFRDYYSAFLPDTRIREPINLAGSESLKELLVNAVTPGNEVTDRISEVEEVFSGLFGQHQQRTGEEQ